jgi:cytochrome c553
MNRFSKSLVMLAAVTVLMQMHVFQSNAAAPGPKVTENLNKHNLSAGYNTATIPPVFTVGRDSSINYKATDDPVNNPGGRQICIFCHTPHNASSEASVPLWNRKLSTQTFSRYSSGTLQIRNNPAVRAANMANYDVGAQPDGSSKLCLSCHDGVSGLGDVLRGGPIAMRSGFEVINGIASFNPTTNPNKMKFGHHPVSFVYTGPVQQAISSARTTGGFKLPTLVPQVKLDKKNKMQCTTCHDAHQNKSYDDQCYSAVDGSVVSCSGTNTRKVVPFWVLGGSTCPSCTDSQKASADHDTVCTACHNMTQGQPGIAVPWP